MVFAETKRIAKTTAAHMLRMKSFTLPNCATKLRPNAFSLSVLVGCGELAKISSIDLETCVTCSGESTRMEKVPARRITLGCAWQQYSVVIESESNGNTVL